MIVNSNPRIWEFDVDDTLVLWDLSRFSVEDQILIQNTRGPVKLVPHLKNINLLMKLSKIGWYIRVHSGSGVEWAKKVVETLGLSHYVDCVEAKPLGKTDDQEPGDGLAYTVYREQT